MKPRVAFIAIILTLTPFFVRDSLMSEADTANVPAMFRRLFTSCFQRKPRQPPAPSKSPHLKGATETDSNHKLNNLQSPLSSSNPCSSSLPPNQRLEATSPAPQEAQLHSLQDQPSNIATPSMPRTPKPKANASQQKPYAKGTSSARSVTMFDHVIS